MENQVLIQEKKRWGLTGNQLKLIAMLTMLIDHIGVYLYPNLEILRIIGRISFPIFAYMIAEGCRYTRNRGEYLGMIAALGVICQVVFYVAMGSLYMGILITFSLSILCIYAVDNFLKKRNVVSGILMVFTLVEVLFLVKVLPGMATLTDYDVDYGLVGIVLPIAVYYMPKKAYKLAAVAGVLLSMGLQDGGIYWYAMLSLPFLALYNGERGKHKLKYMFYIFYPAHLVLLYVIGMLMWMS